MYGQPVTFTATVKSEDGTTAVPTGTVTFKAGNTLLGTAKLQQGRSSVVIPRLAAGSHSITAQYSGDANFAVSTSIPMSLVGPNGGSGSAISSPLPVGPGVVLTPQGDKRSESGAQTVQGNYIGTTYFVGTANGGVWKNVDGTALTISSLNPVDLGVTLLPANGGGSSITSVANGSLAQQLGLQLNDRIPAANGQLPKTTSAPLAQGQTIESSGMLRFEVVGASLKLVVRGQSPKPAVLVVDRGGKTINVSVFLNTNNTARAVDPTADNAWRYKHQNGEWWYYTPDEKWLVHRNGQWVSFTATVSPGTGPSGPATGTLNNNSGNNTWTGPIVLDNRVDSGPGRTVIPVPADLDGDGRSKPRTLIPGVRLPQRSVPNSGSTGSPLRTFGGKR